MKWLSTIFFLFSVHAVSANGVAGADAAAIQAQLEGLKKGVIKPIELEKGNVKEVKSAPGADILISDDVFADAGANISVVDDVFDAATTPIGNDIQKSSGNTQGTTPTSVSADQAAPEKRHEEKNTDLIAKCNMSGDLTMMLSPECLNFLKPAFNPGRIQNSAPSPSPSKRTSASEYLCNVSVFMGENFHSLEFKPQASTSLSFRAPTLVQCIANGSRMGFGHQGITNITAFNDAGDSVFVSCRRTGLGGVNIQCKQER